MHKKAYSIYTLAAVAALMLALSAACLLSPERDFSESERRSLAKFPELSAQTLLSGKFMEEFESYSLDQFPLRDSFRRLKAIAQYHLFRLKDSNGIYLADGYAAKLVYPLHEASVLDAAEKFRGIYDAYLAESDRRIVVSIVPDKGYFLGEANGYPSMDYERLEQLLTENMPYAAYCGIADTLSIDAYYRTDTHWRQEKIFPAAEKLAAALGVSLREPYTVHEAETDFYGVYYGQSALPLAPDRISYVTGDAISAAAVYNAETGQTGGVYDFAKLRSRDPYEFFLSGASAVLAVENPAAGEERELVIFRDSFGSAIAPYLIEAYSRITLVDTRYIAPALLGDYVDFTDCDVLFLYSTLVLNESTVLR
ncbi:MAG: DHHW family protein [Oscillospiraceae bacterium]